MIERAAILSNGPLLEIADALDRTPAHGPGTGTLDDVERAYVVQVLTECGWVVSGQCVWRAGHVG